MSKIIVFVIIGLFMGLVFFPIINGSQNNENQILLQISQTQDKLLIKDKIIGDIHVTYWHHVIDGVVIKNDYILLQENPKDNSIIKFEKEWTDMQDLRLDIMYMNLDTINIDENIVACKEKVVFPEENDLKYFYSVDKNQLFPLSCWEVRYKDGNTILYNVDGSIIGNGIPAPNEGFSLSGFNDDNYPDPWLKYRLNADSWFKKWCDSTTSISLPSVEVISSYVSNPVMNIFYEIAHSVKLPTRFQANAEGVFYTADQIHTDMENRDPMRFAILCSCEAMREVGPGTLSYEFRKGELQNTVTVGYVGMADCPGWSVSLEWQDYMFYYIDSNYTFKEAFDLACSEYPIIADCVLFIGDPTIKIWEPEKYPDLECEGAFSWIDLKPGATVNGSFIVKNIGDAGSILNWNITEYPSWGTWYFTPSNGDNVTPEDGIVTVDVEVIAPDTQKMNFSGEIKIENKENTSDYEIINVLLTTYKDKEINILILLIEKLIYRFPFLEKILNQYYYN